MEGGASRDGTREMSLLVRWKWTHEETARRWLKAPRQPPWCVDAMGPLGPLGVPRAAAGGSVE